MRETGESTRLQSLVFEGKLLGQDSEGLSDSFTSRYSGIPTEVEHLWASASGGCETSFQLNRAGNTDLFGVQPLLNRMQHIHVDHALVTQALEHLTLVTNDCQPERPYLALQRYGLQLLGGEIGIIPQKPAGLNELSWFFWIVVFLSVWVIYTTSA